MTLVSLYDVPLTAVAIGVEDSSPEVVPRKTSYPVMGAPPVLDGVVQLMFTSPVPAAPDAVGAAGTVAGVADA